MNCLKHDSPGSILKITWLSHAVPTAKVGTHHLDPRPSSCRGHRQGCQGRSERMGHPLSTSRLYSHCSNYIRFSSDYIFGSSTGNSVWLGFQSRFVGGKNYLGTCRCFLSFWCWPCRVRILFAGWLAASTQSPSKSVFRTPCLG